MNHGRIQRLIDRARAEFRLDLSDLVVFTEAATGYFSLTPIIAALAGAKEVIALGADSEYGSFSEARKNIQQLARIYGCERTIKITKEKLKDEVGDADIVTNLGFVRPIDKTMIGWMKPTACIPLMWEPWEYRPQDIDLDECVKKGIVVLGTNESSELLRTFDFVGMLAVKLLLELDIEVLMSSVLVVGGGIFGRATVEMLKRVGAKVGWLTITEVGSRRQNLRVDSEIPSWTDITLECNNFIRNADAIVIVEHHERGELFGLQGRCSFGDLARMNKGIVVAHICGTVDENELKDSGLNYIPKEIRKGGYMSVSTAYVGPRPLIDLHTAGLRVGELLARARLNGKDIDEAKREAITYGPGKDFKSAL